MYQDKIVVALKVNGRILRESGDTVSLPFGSEYSILIKNLNSVRAQVSVSVDGQNATDGCKLIIAPNSSLDLERFIKNGNFKAGNRFKFIERTEAIEEHRGVGAEDGLIRVEAWKEHIAKFVNVPVPRYYDDPIPVPQPYYPYWPPKRTPHIGSLQSSCRSQPQARGGGSQMRSFMRSVNSTSASASVGATANSAFGLEQSAAGITVPGSKSSQQFYAALDFAVEPGSVVMVLKLRGEIAGIPVSAPITVDVKPICQTCGKTGEATAEFCSRCGTSLLVIA